MKTLSWMVAAWASLVALAGATNVGPYYIEGMLVERYREPASLSGPEEGSGFSLRSAASPRAAAAEPPPSPPSGPPPRAWEALRLADSYINKGNWSEALTVLKKALEEEPRNELLLRRAGAVAALAKDYVSASDYYRRLLAAHPEGVEFMNGRAAALIRLKQFLPAEQLINRALSLDPGNLLARFNRLILYAARGDDLSMEHWRDLSAADLLSVANWLQADRQDYESLMGADRFAAVCQVAIGTRAAEKLPQIVEVLTAIRRAQRTSKWEDVLQHIAEARKLGIAALGLNMDEAQAALELNDFERALELMRELVEEYPDRPRFLYNYAYLLIRQGRYAEALPFLDRAYARAPKNPQVAFARACMLAENDRMEEAWPILAELARERPAELRTWLRDDAPYYRKIKADPRFPTLMGAGTGRSERSKPRDESSPE